MTVIDGGMLPFPLPFSLMIARHTGSIYDSVPYLALTPLSMRH